LRASPLPPGKRVRGQRPKLCKGQLPRAPVHRPRLIRINRTRRPLVPIRYYYRSKRHRCESIRRTIAGDTVAIVGWFSWERAPGRESKNAESVGHRDVTKAFQDRRSAYAKKRRRRTRVYTQTTSFTLTETAVIGVIIPAACAGRDDAA